MVVAQRCKIAGERLDKLICEFGRVFDNEGVRREIGLRGEFDIEDIELIGGMNLLVDGGQAAVAGRIGRSVEEDAKRVAVLDLDIPVGLQHFQDGGAGGRVVKRSGNHGQRGVFFLAGELGDQRGLLAAFDSPDVPGVQIPRQDQVQVVDLFIALILFEVSGIRLGLSVEEAVDLRDPLFRCDLLAGSQRKEGQCQNECFFHRLNSFSKNGRTDPNKSRAFLHGDGPVFRHAHGNLVAAGQAGEALRERLEGAEFPPDLFLVVGKGGHAHHAAQADVGIVADVRGQRLGFFGQKPLFRGFLRDMDFQQAVDGPSHCAGFLVDGGEEPLAVDGVDQGDVGEDQLDLVGLQVPDQVPLDVAREDLRLGGQLLGPVFPKDALAGVIRFADGFHGLEFGNCHQRHG